MKYLIFSSLFFAFSLSISAQTKTVTNASLEKYRQARVKAEKEYRENYQRLGMPSPEEIDRREAERRRETAELSARLRAEQTEKARYDAVRQQYEAAQRQIYYNNQPNYQTVYTPNFGFGVQSFGFGIQSGGFNNFNRGNRFFRQNYPQYDNATRLWSFTNIQPNPPRQVDPGLIIRTPRRR